MLTIGITGGIGSGKSFICDILEKLGYPVFYADAEAKAIVASNRNLIEELEQITSRKLWVNNELDKPALASAIFSSDSIREKVNQAIHPLVHKAFQDFAQLQTTNFVFEEAAIILENGNKAKLDKIILVTAPLEVRIQRVLKRDNTTREKIQERINSQMSDEEKIPLADFVIVNDGVEPLLRQVLKTIEEII